MCAKKNVTKAFQNIHFFLMFVNGCEIANAQQFQPQKKSFACCAKSQHLSLQPFFLHVKLPHFESTDENKITK